MNQTILATLAPEGPTGARRSRHINVKILADVGLYPSPAGLFSMAGLWNAVRIVVSRRTIPTAHEPDLPRPIVEACGDC